MCPECRVFLARPNGWYRPFRKTANFHPPQHLVSEVIVTLLHPPYIYKLFGPQHNCIISWGLLQNRCITYGPVLRIWCDSDTVARVGGNVLRGGWRKGSVNHDSGCAPTRSSHVLTGLFSAPTALCFRPGATEKTQSIGAQQATHVLCCSVSAQQRRVSSTKFEQVRFSGCIDRRWATTSTANRHDLTANGHGSVANLIPTSPIRTLLYAAWS